MHEGNFHKVCKSLDKANNFHLESVLKSGIYFPDNQHLDHKIKSLKTSSYLVHHKIKSTRIRVGLQYIKEAEWSTYYPSDSPELFRYDWQAIMYYLVKKKSTIFLE